MKRRVWRRVCCLRAVATSSRRLAGSGVVIEPTRLRPVYAHKGMVRVTVTAEGVAAHTSTGRGVSANFLIAPFLAEMTHLAERFSRDKRFMNGEFNPPTNGFNMVIDDGGCPHNVTAAGTVCTMTLRTMPDDHRDEALALIAASAQRHNLAFASNGFDPVYTATATSSTQPSPPQTPNPRPHPTARKPGLQRLHQPCRSRPGQHRPSPYTRRMD